MLQSVSIFINLSFCANTILDNPHNIKDMSKYFQTSDCLQCVSDVSSAYRLQQSTAVCGAALLHWTPTGSSQGERERSPLKMEARL